MSLTIKVECHSELEYAERPVAFTWQGERIHIDEIVAQWRTPLGKRFQISTIDERAFMLTYADHIDQWDIQQIESSVIILNIGGFETRILR